LVIRSLQYKRYESEVLVRKCKKPHITIKNGVSSCWSNKNQLFFNPLDMITMQKIKDLAINDSGFAFDPTTGASFTLNEVATQIISSLKDQDDLQLISLKLTEIFDVDFEQAYQDVQEFVEQLKTYKLIS
jgi:hypothetical protein